MVKHRKMTDVFFKPIIFEVDASTNYYAIPRIPDYKFFMKKGPTAVTFLTYNIGHEITSVVRVGIHDDIYLFVTSHFIDRFIERHLKTQVSKIDAVCQFVVNNINFTMTSYPIENKPNNYIGVSDEVIFFGESYAPNIVVARTCITREMLFNNQLSSTDILDQGFEIVLKYRDDLKKLMVSPDTKKYGHISFY